MRRVLGVHPSGYHAWCRAPLSDRVQDGRRGYFGEALLSWRVVACMGYRKVHADLRTQGEPCKHRVARLMRLAGLKAQIGYGRGLRLRGECPAIVAPNRLQQQFDVGAPNRTWVTDYLYPHA